VAAAVIHPPHTGSRSHAVKTSWHFFLGAALSILAMFAFLIADIGLVIPIVFLALAVLCITHGLRHRRREAAAADTREPPPDADE
jgi:hypothetical protein